MSDSKTKGAEEPRMVSLTSRNRSYSIFRYVFGVRKRCVPQHCTRPWPQDNVSTYSYVITHDLGFESPARCRGSEVGKENI